MENNRVLRGKSSNASAVQGISRAGFEFWDTLKAFAGMRLRMRAQKAGGGL
jgi:hypothetical protein